MQIVVYRAETPLSCHSEYSVANLNHHACQRQAYDNIREAESRNLSTDRIYAVKLVPRSLDYARDDKIV